MAITTVSTSVLLRKSSAALLSLVVGAGLLAPIPSAEASSISSDYKTYVMAPLTKITDWNAFRNQLITLKNNNVYAVTTDVWWGDVEGAGDNVFDWSYYKTYADTVRAAGLKWVPILSTHQCGGNVGDDCDIKLPNWLWSKGTQDQLTIRSETGFYNKETLSPWWSGTAAQYDELYASFASNFSGYKDIIAKIYLSGGPAGELRFPSYNTADGWSYPSRGKLQAYTDSAKADFRTAMQTKYGTVGALNTAWGTSLASFSDVSPPSDGDNFFTNGYKSNYGKDFLTWYQGVLEKHVKAIGAKAHSRFDSVFGVPVGAKISGVHWQMNNPTMPHSAEYGAGYYNYSTLLDAFKSANLDLTFTCLEMTDAQANTAPYYSAPKSLVIQVSNLANQKGIRLNGENALAIGDAGQYQNVAEMLFNYNFSGFTLLRMSSLVNASGTATSLMSSFRDALAMTPTAVTFVVKGAPTASGDTVYVTGSRWEMGNWTTGVYPLKLTYNSTTADWRGTAYIGSGRNYEFKAIVKNSAGAVTWEPGSNNTLTVPSAASTYTITW
ncbi:family 14 glycosylhydrolase [Paenibacillus mucilaginosus]|uniref:Beta-amylase n=1 Tax=Paenibacillus mucilaginosus (strain KNP414) TaxID=1036673 RepID=F8FMD2_PAEMK|nr:family 14 glycosylhydrolase [Paenibacillus mucilaginosus]AEI40015.1 Thermophilic beta-amylase [Paenibacillus mucilaginosus KNP414]MCG7216431.1 family 14 glycosylhydrolase [Paenibacillus mucilaginosus]WDM29263.1 family 14 glycosylhydrolase [Paenibacillus mucilaginosus]